MDEERKIPFWGNVSLEDNFPSILDSLPDEAKQYISEKDNNEKYVVAREGQEVVGFAVLQFPTDKNDSVHFGYRYVFPNHRRRGIGKKIRDKTYELCYENGYFQVESGINNIIKILQNGDVKKNLDEKSDGGWKSYFSMTDSNAKIPITHRVKFITIDSRGNLSIAVETQVNSKENLLFPKSPEEFIDFLKHSGTLPDNIDTTELAQVGIGKEFAVFKSGKEKSFAEFLSMLHTR
ncbi:MAG: hypothetical protein AUJ41_04860 [Candidatus Pacebacteria bacterium CG1_02_43_31]|uniref:N-acetyltransferase domain-containing protein n=1 Tax=Candidatus Nomurabacteria bacterium CG22_combo_CG10-13_8_21_14_all_32_8 TaxID=1974732 RepID=A0A2H0CG87_9BACT|nr:MAG: hypothetical protein AUJ41_04860 [Candidatus Pacebacteria bacterium CG1_02_43_31]PIP68927.1 MAG: hypothetical protein COW91_02155 [Candidatus Nomurabacteria bacterium CG22_combo_CG10-13_8_21_14_all_32_8]